MDPATARLFIAEPASAPILGARGWLSPADLLGKRYLQDSSGREGNEEPDAGNGDEDEEPAQTPQEDLDEVDEASRESFPASDPPSFTPLHIGP